MDPLAARFRDRVDARLVAIAKPIVRALQLVHPTRLDGLEHLPDGPAILVGNHGMLGYETLIFFERIYDATGRLPRGCADKWFFRVPVVRDALVRLGGMYGAPQNAHEALGRGELVVCYPGGAREVFKHDRAQRYRLRWERSRGFAKIAARARVPILPFAAAGVDDTYAPIARLRGTGRLWMGDDRYDLPLVVGGLGPLPSPVPFWFRVGPPITPPEGADDDAIVDLHRTVWARAQSMLDELVAEFRRRYRHARRGSMVPACAS